MMDWTDRHARFFLRLLAPHVHLYTEMISTQALLHGDRQRLLRYAPMEHPVIMQLGGSEPDALALCARMAEDAGYDAVNFNVGCPSDRVQQAKIGACLMAEPQRVADCFQAMQSAVNIPVSIKHRLGIDTHASEEHLWYFCDTQVAAGCRMLVVHARIAILQGLSPKENREIPPLCHAQVYALKKRYPQVFICTNGGICNVAEAREHLSHVDGVMIGREAYHNPYILAVLEQALWGTPLPDRLDVLRQYQEFMWSEWEAGTPLSQMTRHILGLFQGQPGARRWRQWLSQSAARQCGPGVLDQALAAMAQIQ